jgi:predicted amidohydrolase YtcJ
LDRCKWVIGGGLKQDGIYPDKLFSERSKYVRWLNLQKSLGIGPLKWFVDKSIAPRSVELTNHLGSMPEN